MTNTQRFGWIAGLVLLISACNGSGGGHRASHRGPDGVDQGSQGITDGVIKVTAYLPVTTEPGHGMVGVYARIDNPVTIVNPTQVSFALDGSAITVPPITNTMLDFGKLRIGDLMDNNLKVCGNTGNKRCNKAFIQIYTVGTPGAGLWNADIAWGAPIYANQTGSARMTVGLDRANAAVVQQIAIPAGKNVLRLSDFPGAAYEMRSDFTNAGAGSYSTTLVVEYGLTE